MGVSGSGKTTVGEILAAAVAGRFVDSDGLHPPENVAKMAAKIPLTDADREPWLARVRSVMESGGAQPIVIACSALKRAYRDRLRKGLDGVRLVFLNGPADLIAARLAARRGHYMPPDLLQSQLATLEAPSPDEDIWEVSIDAEPDGMVARLLNRLAE
jgi:gluconokinase